MDERRITLSYTISDGEEQHLDFYQEPEHEGGWWSCVLTAEEMDKIIRSAVERGTLDDGSDGE